MTSTAGLPALVPTWACALLSCVAMATAAWVDVRERRLPNPLVMVVAVLAAVQMALCALLGLSSPPALPGAATRLVSAVVTLVVLLGVELTWRRLRDEHGIGLGDVKLLAALALWVGPAVVLVLALSCLVALAFQLPGGARTFAFGPYIAVCGCVLLAILCLP